MRARRPPPSAARGWAAQGLGFQAALAAARREAAAEQRLREQAAAAAAAQLAAAQGAPGLAALKFCLAWMPVLDAAELSHLESFNAKPLSGRGKVLCAVHPQRNLLQPTPVHAQGLHEGVAATPQSARPRRPGGPMWSWRPCMRRSA